MEMTSREIMDCLYNSDLKDKREYMRQILSVADFVKFAKVRPLPADNIAAYENAVRFVEETKPVEPVKDEKESSATSDSKSATGSPKTSKAESSDKTSKQNNAKEIKKGGEK